MMETVAPLRVVGNPGAALDCKVTGPEIAFARPVPWMMNRLLGETPEFG